MYIRFQWLLDSVNEYNVAINGLDRYHVIYFPISFNTSFLYSNHIHIGDNAISFAIHSSYNTNLLSNLELSMRVTNQELNNGSWMIYNYLIGY